jgi:hypothetical protein
MYKYLAARDRAQPEPLCCGAVNKVYATLRSVFHTTRWQAPRDIASSLIPIQCSVIIALYWVPWSEAKIIFLL